jgi:hypothetical protein
MIIIINNHHNDNKNKISIASCYCSDAVIIITKDFRDILHDEHF